jgi:hypothetical protein
MLAGIASRLLLLTTTTVMMMMMLICASPAKIPRNEFASEHSHPPNGTRTHVSRG